MLREKLRQLRRKPIWPNVSIVDDRTYFMYHYGPGWKEKYDEFKKPNKTPYQNFWGNPQIGEGTKIGAYVEIGKGVKIGRNCKIEAFVFIPPGVTIGDNCFIGPHACFTNDKHPAARGDWKSLETTIEDGVSIGANATILPGLSIGQGAVVGAGAVVTRSVRAETTVVGNPARGVSERL